MVMAKEKKEKEKKKAKAKKKSNLEKLSKSGKKTQKEFNEASRVATKTGMVAPLERVQTEANPETQDYLNSLIARSDPTSRGFAGRRSEEAASGIQGQDDAIGTSSEMKVALEGLRSTQERTAETDKILKTMEGGLAGLSAAENTAIREGAQRQSQSALKTALANVQQTAARSGARGFSQSANMANVNRQFGLDTRAAEQDLLVKNIDIQDSRRRDYASTAAGAEQREADRRDKYTNALGTEEDSRFKRGNIYLDSLRGLEKDENDRTLGSQELTGRALSGQDALTAKGREFNALQGNSEQGAKSAAIAGIADYQNTRDMGRKQLKLLQGNKSSSSSSSSGETTNTGSSLDELNAAIDQAKGYYKDQYGA